MMLGRWLGAQFGVEKLKGNPVNNAGPKRLKPITMTIANR